MNLPLLIFEEYYKEMDINGFNAIDGKYEQTNDDVNRKL